MAIPGVLDQPKVSAFQSPDSADTLALESLERGGIALNDPSRGRLYQDWRARIDGATIKIGPVGGAETVILTINGEPSEVSLAFDANMNPTIAYVEAGVAKLYWFNILINNFQTDIFTGATQPRVATDDKRETREGASDVILSYARNGSLYYRQQRERYLIEHLVGAVPDGYQFEVCGMNDQFRFQWRAKKI